MTKREEYEQKTEQLLQPIIDRNQFELVDVEYVTEANTNYLRAFIDKEGGITIQDCELVSRALSDLLDEKDFIPDTYILEVSSPGLGRQLKKEKHFQRSLGETVEVKLFKAIDKQKEFEGVLVSATPEKLILDLEDGSRRELLRSDIAVVRLALDF